MSTRRIITWLGAEHDVVTAEDIAKATGIPQRYMVHLRQDNGNASSQERAFIFDTRALAPGAASPPLPPLPPPPLADAPVPATAQAGVLRARADVLRTRSLEHLLGVRRSVREQHSSLRALDAALQTLRDASAHGAPTGALSEEWRGVVQAVAGERTASEGLPAQSAPEAGRQLLLACEAISQEQARRQQTACSLEAVEDGQLVAQLASMEADEVRLRELHVTVLSSQQMLRQHAHARLQRVTQLQHHMASLYRRAAEMHEQHAPRHAPEMQGNEAAGSGAGADAGGGGTGSGGAGGAAGGPAAAGSSAAPSAANGSDSTAMEDLGDGVLVPRMLGRRQASAAGAAAAAGSAGTTPAGADEGEPTLELTAGLTTIGNYAIARCIGSGSFAQVFLLRRLPSAALAAGPEATPGAAASPQQPPPAPSSLTPAGLTTTAPALALKAIERSNLTPKTASLLASEVRIH